MTFVMPHMAFSQTAACEVNGGGQIIIIGGKAICFPPTSSSCPVTVGTLTLSGVVTRSSAISPLVVWFDATGTIETTTLSGANTAFQDVYYAWTFGDTGASGTGTWAYGSNGTANGGTGNSRNTATGPIVAHEYIVPDGSGDKNYTVQVVAFDGTNTASCNIGVTAFDQSGANGFTAANTTCYFNSTVGSGCPAGATQTTTSVFSQTNGTLTNKRLLYKCGDTFTGDSNVVSGSKVRIGAYGTCQQTKTNRPIFNDTSTNYHINIARTVSDVAISDIDMESSGGTSAGAIGDAGGSVVSNSQVTINNVMSAGNKAGFSTFSGTQTAVVDSEIVSGITTIALHINSGENNCVNGSAALNCGGVPSYIPIQYIAVLGTHVKGAAGAGLIESLRIEAWQWLVVSNNDTGDSAASGSPMKIHSGNTFGTSLVWIGQYSQYAEISDNYFFGQGGGGGCEEVAPQNGGTDERIKFVIIERDVCAVNTQGQGVRLAELSAQNLTIRDNVYLMNGNSSLYAIVGPQIVTRASLSWPTINNEAYNITCNVTTSPVQGGQECVGFDALGGLVPAGNSFAANVMIYTPGATGHSAVSNTGSGNTISNNTTNSSLNPAWTNGSGTFDLITDWKPTANFSGATSVPNYHDALGVAWSPTWDLGAVHH